MKLLIVLALVAVVLARPDDTYDSRYDNFNVDEMIENETLFKNYLKCFLGEGKCTPEGKQIRGWMPEAINSSCGKCTGKQKILVAKSIKAAKQKFPTEYNSLVAQHDPEGKHSSDLEVFLAKYSS